MKALVSISFVALFFSINVLASSIRSITPRDTEVGKWLINISVGHGVPEEALLSLRNLMVDVFSTSKGGLYIPAINIDDLHNQPSAPTKAVVTGLLDDLRKRINLYKEEHPNAKTMIAFGLTGHGMTEDNAYSFWLSDGFWSGKEIVDMIKSFGVDETVLIVQSCQSGSLVDSAFPSDNIEGLRNQIIYLANQIHLPLSVVTPVSRFINSPFYIWENNVLAPSFNRDAFDVNKDDIVTYEEWKNAVMQLACMDKFFIPNALFSNQYPFQVSTIGIDPQFFDPLIPADLPLFLTTNGTDKYNKNLLTLPAYQFRQAQVYPQTKSICDLSFEYLDYIYRKDAEDLLSQYKDVPLTMKKRIIYALMKRDLKLSDSTIKNIGDYFFLDTDFDLRVDILSLLIKISSNTDSISAIKQIAYLLMDDYSKETSIEVKDEMLNLFSSIRLKEAYPIFMSEIHNENSDLRVSAIIGIGYCEKKEIVPELLQMAEQETAGKVRAALINAFRNLGAREAIPFIIKTVRFDQYVEAVVEGIYAVAVLEINELIPDLIENIKPVHEDQIRITSIIVLAKMHVAQAIQPIIGALSTDSNEWVRVMAARSLGEMRAKEAIPALTKAMNEDTSSYVREEAKKALELMEI